MPAHEPPTPSAPEPGRPEPSRLEPGQLELIHAFALYGSVTGVAEASLRSPSAVSQALKAAERALGMKLTQPAGRGLELTEAGRLLAAGGAELARTLARVQADWDDYRGQPRGRVRLAAFPSAAEYILPGVLRELADTDIELECVDDDTAEAGFARLTRDFDLVLAHSYYGARPVVSEGLEVVTIVDEPLDVALRTGHRLAGHAHVTPAQVVREDWIGVPTGYPFDRLLQAIAEVAGRAPRVVQRLRDNRLVEAVVRSGDCLAILPRFTTRPGDGLELRPLHGLRARRRTSVVMRPDRAQRLAVRRVVEAIRTSAQAVAGPRPPASNRR